MQSFVVSLNRTDARRDASALLPHTLAALSSYFIPQSKPQDSLPSVNLQIAQFRFEPGTKDIPSMIQDAPLYAALRSVVRARQLADEYAYLPESLRTRAFPLFGSNDVDVVVHCYCGSRVLQMWHPCLSVGYPLDTSADLLSSLSPKTASNAPAVRSMYAQTAREKQRVLGLLLQSSLANPPPPLLVHFDSPSEISIGAGGATAIPVTVFITNEAPQWPISFQIRLLPAGSTGSPVTQTAVPWLGKTLLRGSIAPGETIQRDTLVMVPAEGLYQLGDWYYEANIGDEPVSGISAPRFTGAGTAGETITVLP